MGKRMHLYCGMQLFSGSLILFPAAAMSGQASGRAATFKAATSDSDSSNHGTIM